MGESLSCPQCTGPRDAKALHCPFCGAIFSRLSQPSEPTVPSESGNALYPPPASAPAAAPVPAAPAYGAPVPVATSAAAPMYSAPAPVPAAPAAAAPIYSAPVPTVPVPAPPAPGMLSAQSTVQGFNPYHAPASNVAVNPASRPVEVPEEIAKKIKNAWVAAVISGSLTLLFVLIAISTSSDFGLGIDAWTLFDVVLIFGLAYGISRKNRACATFMFLYFVATKIYQWVAMESVSGLPLALVFIYYFYQGIVGTSDYHKHQTGQQ